MFELKCLVCGNDVILNKENIAQYFKSFGYRQEGVLKEDEVTEDIIIFEIIDGECGVLCKCRNLINYS